MNSHPQSTEKPTSHSVPQARSALRSRRLFLAQGGAVAGAMASGAVSAASVGDAKAAEPRPPGIAPWQTVPGVPAGGYGQPSQFETSILRHVLKPYGDIAPGTGPTFSPIEALEGTITPSGLHYVRNHNGIPDIDPAQHRLMLHGLVRRPA